MAVSAVPLGSVKGHNMTLRPFLSESGGGWIAECCGPQERYCVFNTFESEEYGGSVFAIHLAATVLAQHWVIVEQ